MRTRTVTLERIVVPAELAYQRFSSPDLVARLSGSIPPLPALFVDAADNLVFSAALLEAPFFRNRKRAVAVACSGDTRRALLQGWHLQQLLLPPTLYQQLLFARAAQRFIGLAELQKAGGFSFTLNRMLLENLSRLLEPPFEDGFRLDKLSLKACLRMLQFPGLDFAPLIALFGSGHYSDSEQLLIVDLMSDLAFKTGESIARITASVKESSGAGGELIKQALRRRLYPQYSQDHEKWLERIRKLRLPPEIKADHYPFFEKRQFQLSLKVTSEEKLNEILARILDLF